MNGATQQKNSPFYYCASEKYIKSTLFKINGSNDLFSSLSFENKENCVRSKQQIEALMSSENLLCHSWWSAMESFIENKPFEYISIKFSGFEICVDCMYEWPSMFIYTYKYCLKQIDIVLYYCSLTHDYDVQRAKEVSHRHKAWRWASISGVELLAKMMWDSKNEKIILTPIIISEVLNAHC